MSRASAIRASMSFIVRSRFRQGTSTSETIERGCRGWHVSELTESVVVSSDTS